MIQREIEWDSFGELALIRFKWYGLKLQFSVSQSVNKKFKCLSKDNFGLEKAWVSNSALELSYSVLSK